MGAGGADPVAVVKNRHGIDLTVTLVKQRDLLTDTQKRQPLLTTSQNDRGQVTTTAQTDVEKFPQTTTGVQICDDRFVSSYQVAHCNVTPSSPPLCIPEFPLRTTSCTNQEARVTQATDLFAGSLRKYPHTSPPFTSSSELIERILSATLSKRINKERSKKTNSLIRNRINKSLHDKQINYATHKNIQTYTRCSRASPTANNSNKTNQDIDFNPVATTSGKTSMASKENQASRSISPQVQRLGRGAEVRYLNDVKKCIRDAIRHAVCDEDTVVCPEIQRRLSVHQKECRNACSNQATLSRKGCISTEGRTPNTSRDIGNRQNVPEKTSTQMRQEYDVSDSIKLRDQASSVTGILHLKSCCRFCKKEREYEEKLRKQVFDWLLEIPINVNCSSDDQAIRQNMMKKLINILLKYKGMEDKQRKEIKRCLDVLPMWLPVDQYDRDLFKKKLTENLLIRLNVLSDDHNDLKEIVSNWMDEILKNENVANNQVIDKENILNNIVVRIKSLKGDELSDGHLFKDTLKTNVINLLKEVPVKSINNEKNFLDKAADKLVTKITSINPDNIPSTRQRKESAHYLSDKYENQGQILENIKGFGTNLDLGKDADLNDVEYEMNNKDIQSQLKDEIKKVIEIIKKDNLDSKTESLLMEALIMKLKVLPDLKYNNIVGETRLDKPQKLNTEHIPKQKNNFIKKQNMQECIEKVVSQVFEELPVVIDHKIKKGLKDEIINTIAKKLDTDQLLENKDLNDLVKSKITTDSGLSDTISLSEISISLENDVQNYVKEQVSDILNAYGVEIDTRRKIQNNLNDILTNHIMRGDTDNKFEEITYSMLQELNLPENKTEELYKTLLQNTRDMSMSFKNKTSTPNQNLRRNVSMERINGDFLKNAEIEIINLICEITGNYEPEFKKKIVPTIKYLASDIEKIVRDSKHSTKDKLDTVNKLISNFLCNRDLATDMRITKKFAKRLLKTTKNTSTPRKKSIGNYLPYSSKESKLSSIPGGEKYFDTLDQESLDLIYESPENDFLSNELKTVIVTWITNSNLKTNATEAMIKDLIRDIIKRKKYLRLNPEMQPSNVEEFKYLKILVSKWLDKLNGKSLINIDTLVNQINDLYSQKLPSNVVLNDTILNVISEQVLRWIQNIPSDRLISHNKNSREIMAKELTKQIRETFKHSANPELSLERELQVWLPKIVKESNENELHVMKDELKSYLKEKALPGIHSIPKHNTRLLTEQLHDGITAWLKSSSLREIQNTKEKNLQGNFASNLARDLNHIISNLSPNENIEDNELILKSIETRIKQLLLDSVVQYDDKYYRKVAEDILNHLRGLNLFRNIPENNSEKDVKSHIFSWLQNLPLQLKTPSSDAKVVVDDINSILCEFLDSNYVDHDTENCFKKKVTDVLKTLPMREGFQSYDKLQILVDNLFRTIKFERKDTSKQTNIPEASRNFEINTQQFLRKEIEKCCERLSITRGDRPEDKAKVREILDCLVSGLSNILNKVHTNSNLFNNDILYDQVVKDEIEKLISTSSIAENLKGNILLLKNDLVNIVKNATKSDRKTLAEDIYKKHLHDAIDNQIPTTSNFSTEQLASFEDLKEKLVEAFMSLHNITNGDRSKYKETLKREVNKFCHDYLAQYPATPVIADDLCNELYTVLQNVSFPDGESVTSKIEQSQIQDDIDRYLAELPLENNKKNKSLRKEFKNFLFKRLKVDQQQHTPLQSKLEKDGNLEKEIFKWLKLFTFNPEHKPNIKEITKNIIRKIKKDDQTENYNEITEQKLTMHNYSRKQWKEPLSSKLMESSLVNENRAKHSDELLQESPLPSRYRVKTAYKDVGVSKDIGNQTEVRPECSSSETNEYISETSNRKHETRYYQNLIRPTSCTSVNCLDYDTSPGHNKSQEAQTKNVLELSPRIVVKEYYWDSTASCQLHNSHQQLQHTHSQLRRTIPSMPLTRNNATCPRELYTNNRNTTKDTSVPSRSLCQSKISTIQSNLAPTPISTKQQSLEETNDPWIPIVQITPKEGYDNRQANENHASRNMDKTESYISRVKPNCITQRPQCNHKIIDCTISNHSESRCRINRGYLVTRELPDGSVSRSDIVRMPSELDLECSSIREGDSEEAVRCRCHGRTFNGFLSTHAHDTEQLSHHECTNRFNKCFKCRGALCPHPSYLYFN